MFDNLISCFSNIIDSIRGKNRITKKEIDNTLDIIRGALLDADVALPVVTTLIKRLKSRFANNMIALLASNKHSQFIKIIQNELIELLGTNKAELNLKSKIPSVILIIGLQGSGKTTSISKISNFFQKNAKKKILVTSTDIYRPAATHQLATLVSGLHNVDYYMPPLSCTPIQIATAALNYADKKCYDILLVDTAGRITNDTTMMKEVKQLYSVLNPIETLLIIDAMTGQSAVYNAQEFNKNVLVTGVVLTKMDSDVRGGAALSIRYITNIPVKFIGVGEKVDDLEVFYPDRVASRILGMGDITSLLDNLKKNVDGSHLKKLVKKPGDFSLEDFCDQIRNIKKMGGVATLLDKLPYMSSTPHIDQEQQQEFYQMETIINSMTLEERQNPRIIKNSRKKRIALGSGTNIRHINRLLKQFFQAKTMMKNINKIGIKKTMGYISDMMNNKTDDFFNYFKK